MSKFIEVDSFTDLKDKWVWTKDDDERHQHLLKASPYITGEKHGCKYIVAYVDDHHYVAYVSVPKDSDVCGVDSNWLHQDYPSVNGEVTWSGRIGICDDDHYIGWDYAHTKYDSKTDVTIEDTDRYISEGEIMGHVSNCAEWINKSEHKVVCDHCGSELNKGKEITHE